MYSLYVILFCFVMLIWSLWPEIKEKQYKKVAIYMATFILMGFLIILSSHYGASHRTQ